MLQIIIEHYKDETVSVQKICEDSTVLAVMQDTGTIDLDVCIPFINQQIEVHHNYVDDNDDNNYSDGSGTYGWVYLTFCDLATGQVSQVMFNDFDFTMFNGYKVWERWNSFIVDDCDVWRNKDINVYADKTVYRTI